MNSLILLACLVFAPVETPKGHLVIAGGGGTAGAITGKALELAGKSEAAVLVVPQASSLPDAGQSSKKMWQDLGAKSVDILKLDDPKNAVEQVRAANLIWIGGGDQNRLMKAIKDTGVPEAIRQRYRDGAVVGGTSAGAAVMSKVMITGEADLTGVKGGATQTAEGLGLWPHVIVDQHFLKRQRFNRLLSAVIDHPDLVGVGIDEATAVVVTNGKFEVIGASHALILDARRGATKSEAGQLSHAAGIRLHLLKPGQTFDIVPLTK